MNFKEELATRQQAVERILADWLPAREGYQEKIMEAMNYSVQAGGKRLRPILLQETYRLFGGRDTICEPFMAAIEMIHTYSLVHDDLPAMDNDDYRRGRATTHKVYGEGMGILAGDALLNYAFETASQAFQLYPGDQSVCQALQVLGKKAGIYGMIGGQTVDIESAGQAISEEKLNFIYRLKTCALIEAAMMTGAILAGASEAQVQIVEQVAADIGMAFQIQDDILDVTSSVEVLGKPIHSDEKNEKTTYVTLKGIAGARAEVARISGRAKENLSGLQKCNPFLEELIDYLIDREA